MLVLFALFANKSFSQPYTEYELKAAYLFNFGKFIQWPDSFNEKQDEFVIGIYGKNPFGEILESTIKNKTLADKPIKIIICENDHDVLKCHVVFFTQVNIIKVKEIIKLTNEKPILTVGDNIDDFCLIGGLINFTPQYSRHRFEINNNAAINNNLLISSKLLSLARIITEDEIKF